MPTDSAAGPGRLTVRQLRSCSRSNIARLFNFWLFTSYVPEALKHARTTLIQKAPDASTPDRFRPSPWPRCVCAWFRRSCPGVRLKHVHCPLGPVQRAFIPADGTAENVRLLHAITRESSHELQSLSGAWIGVAKAFDSGSHITLSVGLQPESACHQRSSTCSRDVKRVHD